MAESQPSTSADCTSTDTQSQTQTIVLDKEEGEQSQPVLQLRLQQPKNEQKVKWTTDTVDNEFMGKKKSKCCCIYEKPKVFGESESSSDEEEEDDCTMHCRGHKKKCYRHYIHKPDEFKDPDLSSPDNNDSSKHFDASGSASPTNEV